MDIRELRIGDVILYYNKIVTVKAIYDINQVKFLIKKKGNLIEIIANCEEIEPILITKKILKEIGFENYSNNKRYELKDCEYDMMYNAFHSSSCDKNNIKYLHQLQHELFDSNINIKINLI